MHYPPLSLGLICVSVILPTCAFIAVALRIKSRQIKQIRLNSSDYTIFIACFICLGQLIVGVVGGTIGGLGRPLSALAPETTVIFMKVLFIMQFFHHFAVFFIKLSMVLFYKNIFTTPGFTKVSNFTIGVLVLWITAFFFGTLFQDKPISRNWGTKGTTINYPVFYTVENCTDIILDLVILCMPLPLIRRLNMNTRRKWLLGGVFSLGFFCVVSSVLRLYYLVTFDEQYTASRIDPFSYSTVNYMIWNTVESCASVVTACLPTYVVLFKKTRIGTWLRNFAPGILHTFSTYQPPSSFFTRKKIPKSMSLTDLTQTVSDEDKGGRAGTHIETRCEAIEMDHSMVTVDRNG